MYGEVHLLHARYEAGDYPHHSPIVVQHRPAAVAVVYWGSQAKQRRVIRLQFDYGRHHTRHHGLLKDALGARAGIAHHPDRLANLELLAQFQGVDLELLDDGRGLWGQFHYGQVLVAMDMHHILGFDLYVVGSFLEGSALGQEPDGVTGRGVIHHVAVGDDEIAKALRLDQKPRGGSLGLPAVGRRESLDVRDGRLHPLVHVRQVAGSRPELVLRGLEAPRGDLRLQVGRLRKLRQGRIPAHGSLELPQLLLQVLDPGIRLLQGVSGAYQCLLVQSGDYLSIGLAGLGGAGAEGLVHQRLGLPVRRLQLLQIVRGGLEQNPAGSYGQHGQHDDAKAYQQRGLAPYGLSHGHVALLCQPGHGHIVRLCLDRPGHGHIRRRRRGLQNGLNRSRLGGDSGGNRRWRGGNRNRRGSSGGGGGHAGLCRRRRVSLGRVRGRQGRQQITHCVCRAGRDCKPLSLDGRGWPAGPGEGVGRRQLIRHRHADLLAAFPARGQLARGLLGHAVRGAAVLATEPEHHRCLSPSADGSTYQCLTYNERRLPSQGKMADQEQL